MNLLSDIRETLKTVAGSRLSDGISECYLNPRVQEPAAIRPYGLRVFQTHYQDDKKKYRAPFSAQRHAVRGTGLPLGHQNDCRRWRGGDSRSGNGAFLGQADDFPVKKACVLC